jgi:hypothetical protein
VLDSVRSQLRAGYNLGLDEFFAWYRRASLERLEQHAQDGLHERVRFVAQRLGFD